jgi:hypothetical protein
VPSWAVNNRPGSCWCAYKYCTRCFEPDMQNQKGIKSVETTQPLISVLPCLSCVSRRGDLYRWPRVVTRSGTQNLGLNLGLLKFVVREILKLNSLKGLVFSYQGEDETSAIIHSCSTNLKAARIVEWLVETSASSNRS